MSLDQKCGYCLFWKQFQTNQDWGTCEAITYPDNPMNEDYASMCACIRPEEASDCLEDIAFETAFSFGCVLWEGR